MCCSLKICPSKPAKLPHLLAHPNHLWICSVININFINKIVLKFLHKSEISIFFEYFSVFSFDHNLLSCRFKHFTTLYSMFSLGYDFWHFNIRWYCWNRQKRLETYRQWILFNIRMYWYPCEYEDKIGFHGGQFLLQTICVNVVETGRDVLAMNIREYTYVLEPVHIHRQNWDSWWTVLTIDRYRWCIVAVCSINWPNTCKKLDTVA